MKEAMWGQREYGKSLYLLFILAVNINKTPLKNEVYLKTNRLTTPRVGEDVEDLNSHTLLLGI